MYLILIDSRVNDIPSIVESLTTDTEYITFDFFTDTIQSIKDKIIGQYDSVAIIQHNYLLDEYRLVRDSSDAIIYNLETADPTLNTWQQYIDFLLWLKNERGAAYVDLMACDLWANPSWRYMIETVRSNRGLYLRASIDITGAGGDFILESDNFDTIGVYFTTNILNYKYVFFNQPFLDGQLNTNFNYTPYVLPDSNLAKVSTRYQALLGANSSTTYTTVKQVVSTLLASAILLSNGNVVLVGNSGYGGTMPNGVVSQSDLVNVSRIVSGEYNFIAIKNDRTIVCWGPNANGTDINISNANNDIGVNDVRSQLTNIVDVVVNTGLGFAALRSDGAVITWGSNQYGGNKTTAATYLSSGITNIYPSAQAFFALKNDGTACKWGNGTPIYTTSSFTNSTPIVDIIADSYSGLALLVRKNGNTMDIVLFSTATVYYTLPVGVTIIRKHSNPKGYVWNYFLLFSNNTLGTLFAATWTLYTNVTDVAVSGGGGGGAYAFIQNGTVVVGGTVSYGGSLTDTTYGLKSGVNLTNPVRLVSSNTSLGCIKSDNKFVWWGQINVQYVTIYNSSTFPTDATQTTLYNATNSNIVNIYQHLYGYLAVKNDGSIAVIGPNSGNGVSSTTNYGTKDASMNVYFEVTGYGFFALEIPYLPSVTPSSMEKNTVAVLSYYVSNPDKMAYIGRKYNLYSGATLIDTFIPKKDTHTYVFSNVIITVVGLQTLTIKDESTISYTVDTFAMTVTDVYPCFLEGSKILRFNPDSYQDEYIAVEKLRVGDLVATAESGYKAVHSIGYRTLYNPKMDPNPSNRLYRFNGKEMIEPLYITGEHCTLHRKISKDTRARITEHMGDVYITEEFYRMPAFLDDRAEPYDREDKPAIIWHFALENENVAHNYGVYANGLLVESCAIESLVEKSGMVLISERD